MSFFCVEKKRASAIQNWVNSNDEEGRIKVVQNIVPTESGFLCYGHYQGPIAKALSSVAEAEDTIELDFTEEAPMIPATVEESNPVNVEESKTKTPRKRTPNKAKK